MVLKTGTSATTELNADGRALWDVAMVALGALLCPTASVFLAAKTTANTWDSGVEYDITAGGTITPSVVHVSVRNNPAFLIANALTADPAADGAEYPAGQTHRIVVTGMTRLHFKTVVAGNHAILGLTVFGS